jgi:hypothetical protein
MGLPEKTAPMRFGEAGFSALPPGMEKPEPKVDAQLFLIPK